MFCPKCGQQIANDAKFCGFCGTTINSGEQQAPQQQAPQYQQSYPQYQQYQQPRNPMASNIRIDSTAILYMVAAFLHLLVFIFWWIPSVGYSGFRTSLFKVFTESKATFPAVLIIIFLILGLAILTYHAILNQVTKNALAKFDKTLKLSTIVMQLLMLFATMTIMGPMDGAGAGFPVVAIYICLIGGILVEGYAYYVTEMK